VRFTPLEEGRFSASLYRRKAASISVNQTSVNRNRVAAIDRNRAARAIDGDLRYRRISRQQDKRTSEDDAR
jgi:hypothetical protein